MAKKNIPSINYLILLGVIILIICACFASYNLYNIYKNSQINISPLATNEVLYEDLKSTTSEINADTFLLISYVEDEEVYANEKDIKKSLNKKNLLDNVIYLNITDYKDVPNFLNDLNKTLNLEGNLKVKKFPAIVFYKEGEPTTTIDSSDHLINSSDFEQIIDMYQLTS